MAGPDPRASGPIRLSIARPRVSQLRVDVSRRGDVSVLALRGQLDIYTADDLRTAATACDPRETPLVVDVSGVDLMDSCGLGALVMLQSRAAAADRTIGLVSDGGHIREILRIAGVDDGFAHAEDIDAAIARLDDAATPGAVHAA